MGEDRGFWVAVSSMIRDERNPLICLLLASAALIAFWRLNQCDFIGLDDPCYITKNIHIQHGITIEAVRWAFTTGYAANWHPLTWMSHMLDVQLFALDPHRHHLTNLLFHIANALLLFSVLRRMTKTVWKSAFVAALFALHPLHVESVAWVAERKDVLSTFFWMLTMLAYAHYVEHPRFKSYLAVLIFFALGLMSKPMLVTLPFVLLLLDYWPLQRLHGAGSGKQNTCVELDAMSANKKKGKSGKKRTAQATLPPPVLRATEWDLSSKVFPAHSSLFTVHSSLLLEKIPFFVLAALSCIVTFIVQRNGGAVQSIDVLPPGVRIANAFVSYIIYAGKTIWPNNLAVLYLHSRSLPLWQVMGAGLLLGAVTFAVIRAAKRFQYLAVGWLWFAGTLVPVIGIVQVGAQAMADRYTYIPLIGLFVMAAWGIPELLKNWRYGKEALFISSSLVLASLLLVTWTQVGYWRNDIALYDHALKVTRPNEFLYCNRGLAYRELGNLGLAISDYDRAIEINPGRAELYRNRGLAYGELGDHRRAIEDYNRAIEIDPENAETYTSRGVAYGKLGNYGWAISDYDRAMEIDPKQARAYNDRGVAYGRLGDHRRAVEDFDRAVALDPGYAKAYYNRGAVYAGLGLEMKAIDDLKTAAKLGNEEAKSYLRSRAINW